MADNDAKTQDYLAVKILSPTGVHMETKARSLTAVNDTGEFDILPGHRNFITLLNPCTVKVQTTQDAIKTLDITSGILHVEDNEIKVFLNILQLQT